MSGSGHSRSTKTVHPSQMSFCFATAEQKMLNGDPGRITIYRIVKGEMKGCAYTTIGSPFKFRHIGKNGDDGVLHLGHGADCKEVYTDIHELTHFSHTDLWNRSVIQFRKDHDVGVESLRAIYEHTTATGLVFPLSKTITDRVLTRFPCRDGTRATTFQVVGVDLKIDKFCATSVLKIP